MYYNNKSIVDEVLNKLVKLDFDELRKTEAYERAIVLDLETLTYELEFDTDFFDEYYGVSKVVVDWYIHDNKNKIVYKLIECDIYFLSAGLLAYLYKLKRVAKNSNIKIHIVSYKGLKKLKIEDIYLLQQVHEYIEFDRSENGVIISDCRLNLSTMLFHDFVDDYNKFMLKLNKANIFYRGDVYLTLNLLDYTTEFLVEEAPVFRKDFTEFMLYICKNRYFGIYNLHINFFVGGDLILADKEYTSLYREMLTVFRENKDVFFKYSIIMRLYMYIPYFNAIHEDVELQRDRKLLEEYKDAIGMNIRVIIKDDKSVPITALLDSYEFNKSENMDEYIRVV